MDGYIIGIDLGGMSAKAAIFDKEGKILSKKTVETNAAEGFAGTAAKLATLAEELAEENGIAFSKVEKSGLLRPALWTARRARC